MKKKILLLFLLTSIYCYSQEVQNNQLIVYGYGSVEKESDLAKLSFSIRGLGETLDFAVKDAQKKISAITEKLFSLGLKESNISTQSFSSNENYRDKAFWSSDKDFEANMSVYITLDSLKLLEPVVILISEHNVKNLSSIQFELKNDDEVKLLARDSAIKNAIEKAKIFANNLNIELGNVIYAEELLSYRDGDFYLPRKQNEITASYMIAKDNTTFFAKKFSRSAGVKLIYEINKTSIDENNHQANANEPIDVD